MEPAKSAEAQELIRVLFVEDNERLARLTAEHLHTQRLVLDPLRLTAALDGAPLDLSASEFALLRAFAERPGRVLAREQLLGIVDGSADETFDRAVDSRISRLRQKLGDDPKRPRLLKT